MCNRPIAEYICEDEGMSKKCEFCRCQCWRWSKADGKEDVRLLEEEKR